MTDMKMICLGCGSRMAAAQGPAAITFQCTDDRCGHRQVLPLR